MFTMVFISLASDPPTLMTSLDATTNTPTPPPQSVVYGFLVLQVQGLKIVILIHS